MGQVELAVRLGLRARRSRNDATGVSLNELVSIAMSLERAGIEGLYLTSAQPPELSVASPVDLADPYVALGACAGVTSSIQLGCCPTPQDDRHPSVLAKIATGLDVVSNGRARLVFGSDDIGSDLSIERLSEQLEIARAMVRVAAPSFFGAHYRIDGAFNEPRVAARPMPIGMIVDVPSSGLFDEKSTTPWDLVARFCEFAFVDASSEHAVDFRAFEHPLALCLRRAGRLRSELRFLALMRINDQDAVNLVTRARVHLSQGYDGIVFDCARTPVNAERLQAIAAAASALQTD